MWIVQHQAWQDVFIMFVDANQHKSKLSLLVFPEVNAYLLRALLLGEFVEHVGVEGGGDGLDGAELAALVAEGVTLGGAKGDEFRHRGAF